MIRTIILLLLVSIDAVYITVPKMGVYQWRTNLNGYTIGVPLDKPCKRDTYIDVQLLSDLEENGFSRTNEVDISGAQYTTAEIAYVNGGCKLVQQSDTVITTPPELDKIVAPYGFVQRMTHQSKRTKPLIILYIFMGLFGFGAIITMWMCCCHRECVEGRDGR